MAHQGQTPQGLERQDRAPPRAKARADQASMFPAAQAAGKAVFLETQHLSRLRRTVPAHCHQDSRIRDQGQTWVREETQAPPPRPCPREEILREGQTPPSRGRQEQGLPGGIRQEPAPREPARRELVRQGQEPVSRRVLVP